jgi:SAM-dependent methyltransferase
MLERLAAKTGGERVSTHHGDMVGPLPDGPWSLVVVARNTFFNITSEESQRAALREISRVLAPGGSLVVDAFVPDRSGRTSSVEVRDVGVDRVLLFVDRHDPERQQAWSSFVEMTPEGNRFRPCVIRYATPDQLDEMAAGAGLTLGDRWADWNRNPFATDSARHVSRYEVAPPGLADRRSSIAVDASSPVTAIPRVANGIASRPVPTPSSSTGPSPASAARRSTAASVSSAAPPGAPYQSS